MEKILRLLSPKTTNFDSVGGGSFGALTTQDVCAAISYAELSPIQNILFRMSISHAINLGDVLEATKMILLLKKSNQVINDDQQHQSALYIALVEIFCCVAG